MKKIITIIMSLLFIELSYALNDHDLAYLQAYFNHKRFAETSHSDSSIVRYSAVLRVNNSSY